MTEYPTAYVIPVGDGPAKRRRGEPARRLAAGQRHRGRAAKQGRRHLRRPDVRAGLVRRLDGPGAPRARRHGAQHRRRRLRPDQHALRAARPHGATATSGAPTSSRSRADADFSPITQPDPEDGDPRAAASRPGRRPRYALELDSATAVRALNALIAGGLTAEMALEAVPGRGRRHAAGGHDPLRRSAAMVQLAQAGRTTVCVFRRRRRATTAGLDRPDRPRPADRRPDRRGEPGRLVAPEPRVPGRPGLDGDDQHRRRPIRSRTTTSSSTRATGPARPSRRRAPG